MFPLTTELHLDLSTCPDLRSERCTPQWQAYRRARRLSTGRTGRSHLYFLEVLRFQGQRGTQRLGQNSDLKASNCESEVHEEVYPDYLEKLRLSRFPREPLLY